MGFFRRLLEEGTKQLDKAAKEINEAMVAELEKQANKAARYQAQQGSSSLPNYSNVDHVHYAARQQAHHETTHESNPVSLVDPAIMSAQEKQQLADMRIQMINNQIRRTQEGATRAGLIGTNYEVVYENNSNLQPLSYANTALPNDPISQEQHLSNMRIQMMNNQIRRMEESSTTMGFIGTNNRVTYSGGSYGGGLGGVGY